ncbi:polymorphic toxin-type HINT domain-containing protein [Paenibacillus yanchengensis]
MDALGAAEKFYYDKNGNRMKLIDKRKQQFTYAYDNRNRLLSKQGPSEKIAYSYFNDGSLASMTDTTGTTSYQYDPYTGDLTKLTFADGKTMTYTYDTLGQRTKLKTPFDDEIGYSYTSVNQLQQLTWNSIVEADYEYYLNGQARKEEQGNGVNVARTYDQFKLATLQYENEATTLGQQYLYNYDQTGNITNRQATKNSVMMEDNTFTYDGLNRIATSTLFDESYKYDKRGNRQTLATEATPLDSLNSDYAYDEWDRLTKVTTEEGKEVTYRYNGDNLLVERSEEDTTIRYYYDGQQILSEAWVDPDGTVREKISYLRGNSLAMLETATGEKGYYMVNGHGDVTGITDSEGELLNEYTYDIWGKPLEHSETIEQSFRYSGEYWDEETNLQYLLARWYDPSIGRFINEDTYEGNSGNPLSLNLYTYVQNNPLRYIDPSGHWCESAAKDSSGKSLYSHAGDCNSPTSNWSADYKHHGDLIRMGKNFVGPLRTYNYYTETPIGVIYNDWGKYGDPVYRKAPTDLQDILRSFAYSESFKNGMALEYFIAGVTSVNLRGLDKVVKIPKIKKATGCNCFTEGTKVLTNEGEKPIEEIEVGDKVLAKDDKTGEMAYKEVEWLFQRDVEETYSITVGDEIITTTDEHPFWIVSKGWVESKNLVVGEVLTTSDGKELAIEKIEVKKEHKTVYNFKVKDFHTYFVSNLGVWTHNSCKPAFVTNNRVPIDKETALGNGAFTKTKISPVKGAQVYKKGDNYYHRDTFHKGEGSHLEVYDKRGNHIGEADPFTGNLIPGTRDLDKKINVK